MLNPHDIPAPSLEEPTLRIEALARDLAYGALLGSWSAILPETPQAPLSELLRTKWNNNYPSFNLLVSFDYAQQRINPSTNTTQQILTHKAFDLLHTIDPKTKIFISYCRKESSAVALAVEYKLQSLGIEVFLDKSLKLGDGWHARLEEVVKNCDYFISILATNTLSSPFVVKEITWAQEANRVCIPIWHPNLKIDKTSLPKELSNLFNKYLNANQAIRILEESAKSYDDSIRELVNFLTLT